MGDTHTECNLLFVHSSVIEANFDMACYVELPLSLAHARTHHKCLNLPALKLVQTARL